MPDELNEYLTREEAAALLRLRCQTLACWAVQGRGPRFIRVGGGPRGAVRYSRSELNRWAASRTFGSTAESRMTAGSVEGA
jgi:Helix-turn-helix domain